MFTNIFLSNFKVQRSCTRTFRLTFLSLTRQNSSMNKNCIFCKIASGEVKETELVYTEENYVAFRDHRPAAKFHYLIIPRRHYPGIKHLKKEDIPVIRDLERISHKLMEDNQIGNEGTRTGFHWPLTTIGHLHLHLISPESEMGFFKRIEFSSTFFGPVEDAVKYVESKL